MESQRLSLESLESLESLDDESVVKLCHSYLGDITDIREFYCDGWQERVKPNYQPGSLVQSLPMGSYNTQDYPPLEDFPVCPQLSETSSEIRNPFMRQGAIRRDCFLYFYLPVDCPSGPACENWFCILAHSTLEKMFHPLIYRTEPCRRGITCCRRQCSFLHTIEDDIEASNFWLCWEKHWRGYRSENKGLHESINTTVDAISLSTREAQRLKNALVNVCAIRLGRATKKEKLILEHILCLTAQQACEDLVGEPRLSRFTPFEYRIYQQILNPLLNHSTFAKLPKMICRRLLKEKDNVEMRLKFYEKRQALKSFWIDQLRSAKFNRSQQPITTSKSAEPSLASPANWKTRSATKSMETQSWQNHLSRKPTNSSSGEFKKSDALSAVTRVTAYAKSNSVEATIPERWISFPIYDKLTAARSTDSTEKALQSKPIPLAPCHRNRVKEHEINYRIASGENLPEEFKPIPAAAARARRDAISLNRSYEDLI